MTYTGPWLDDAIETEQLVDTRDSNAPGVGTTSFTWGSTSRSTDQVLSTAAKMDQAWDGTGISLSSQPAQQSAGIQVSASFLGPQAHYDQMWLTMARPAITSSFGTLTPDRAAEIDSTPGVVSLEWEPTAVHETWVKVRAYNIQGNATGLTVPVKFQEAGVTLPRWEAPFEPLGTMNARASLTTLTLVDDGAGTAAGEATILLDPSSAPAFALSPVDPYSAARTMGSLLPGDASDVFLAVELRYTFPPQRYRLIYAGDPPLTPAAPVASRVTPSLRMLQRGGSGGIGGIPRMIGDPTVRGSVRRGPGSVY